MLDQATSVPEPVIRNYGHFIDGEWRLASDGSTFVDHSPATRQEIALAQNGTIEDMDDAIAAAFEAQPSWSKMPPAARAQLFHRAAEIFAERQQEFRDALIQETGSGFGKAMFECGLVPVALREAAALTTSATGEMLPSNVPGKQNAIHRRPSGVVGVISPWNFPLYLSLRGFIYALALGNTAVLKPSEESPITGGTISRAENSREI